MIQCIDPFITYYISLEKAHDLEFWNFLGHHSARVELKTKNCCISEQILEQPSHAMCKAEISGYATPSIELMSLLPNYKYTIFREIVVG